MSTFVLVHGAGMGGWCWHKVVRRLEALGHRVVAPDMPGHGIDRTPIETVTLESIVERLRKVIDAMVEPVILVGHSYGGAAITQVAEWRPGKVRKLVYVAAVLLSDGETIFDAIAGDQNNLLAHIAISPDGKTAIADPKCLREVFFGRCTDDDIALARMLLVPEAVVGLQTPIRTSLTGWGEVPRVFVECSEDRAISIDRQRRFHGLLPCEQVFTLKADHSPFFSVPDELTDILIGL